MSKLTRSCRCSASTVSACAAVGLVWGSSTVNAAAGSTPVPDTAAGSVGLAEVVVTARKREEVAQNVPDSLVVLDEASMEKMEIHQAGDVGKVFPNIGFRQDLSATSTFISVRGITATRNTDPAISLVIDGVQTSNASAIRQQLFDVERIEVLKGPQGSLYGRDAIAGAINVVTKAPTNEFEGHGMLGAGNVKSADAALSFSGPIVEDKLLFRISANYHDDEGMIRDPAVADHTVDFKNEKTARVRVMYVPSDRLTIDFKINHDDFRGGAYYFSITRPIGAPFPVNDPASNSNTYSFQPMSVPISVNYSQIEDQSVRVTYDFGIATLASVSAHSQTTERYGVPGEGIGGNQPGDLDFTPANVIANAQTYDVGSWSEELRLTSSGKGPFRWMGGAYYLKVSRNDTLPVYFLNGSTDPAQWGLPIGPNGSLVNLFLNGTHRNIKAYAAFTQLDYDLTERMTATFGFRYDREDRDQFDKDNPAAPTRSATFDLPEPKLSLSYKPASGQMLYATVSRGFRSGGFNVPRSIFDPVFRPEKLWSYEAGYKGTWAGGRLRTNAAGFYESITDKQDFVFDGVNAAQSIYNIPKSRIDGVELEVAYEPLERLIFNANAGLMDSKIQRFAFGQLFPVPLTNSRIVGNHLPGFSHWGVQAAVDYSWTLGANLTGTAHVDYSLRGKQYWNVTNIDIEKNVGLIGAEFGLERDRYRVTLWGSNLGNTKYWSNWFNQQTTALPDVGYLAEGRRYGLRFSARF